MLSNAFNDDDETFDFIGGFETVQIVPNNLNIDNPLDIHQQLQQQQQSQVYQQATLLRNSNQLRLEPMYVYVSI